MKEKTKSIATRPEDYEKFIALHNSRPQDANNADTMAYLIQFHKEMQEFKPHPRHVEQVAANIKESDPK